MSGNCLHKHWNILPGNVIQCRHCGETIEDDMAELWMADADEAVGQEPGVTFITPLTYHMPRIELPKEAQDG